MAVLRRSSCGSLGATVSSPTGTIGFAQGSASQSPTVMSAQPSPCSGTELSRGKNSMPTWRVSASGEAKKVSSACFMPSHRAAIMVPDLSTMK